MTVAYTKHQALSREFFDEGGRIIEALLQIPDTSIHNFNGLLVFNNSIVTYDQWAEAMQNPFKDEFSLTMYTFTIEFTNAKNISDLSSAWAQSVLISLDFSAFSVEGRQWLKNARFDCTFSRVHLFILFF
jgi:hypothetical protein